MIEPEYDFSADIDEMAEADPDIASELRDKRTNWDLRDRIEKLDHSSLVICKLWAFRDRATIESEKRDCVFCSRSVALAKLLVPLNLTTLCILCWLRAGRPFENEMIQPGTADA